MVNKPSSKTTYNDLIDSLVESVTKGLPDYLSEDEKKTYKKMSSIAIRKEAPKYLIEIIKIAKENTTLEEFTNAIIMMMADAVTGVLRGPESTRKDCIEFNKIINKIENHEPGDNKNKSRIDGV